MIASTDVTKLKLCALPSCDTIYPLRTFAYKLGNHPGEYCSSKCVRAAYDLMKDGKTFAKKDVAVQTLAEEFGDAGIIRRFCDACGDPITLSWKGRSGEYCSNSCLKKAEKESTDMVDIDDEVDEEEVEDVEEEAEEDEAPIRRGAAKKAAPAKKKAVAKKAAPAKAAAPAKKAAAAPAKKAAAASSNGAGRSSAYDDSAVIHVKDLSNHGLRGKRAASLDAMKDGMTIAKFKAALEKKDLKSYTSFALKTALEGKHITLK